MQRQRDGLVPIGEALADLPGPVQAIREATPQAVHHFTQADQVNQWMETQFEVGNIAQHFYNEGPELMVRLEVTEKGMQAIVESWATMN